MDEIPEKYRHDVAIIRETADQIIRDLNVNGFEFILSGNQNNAFEEFKTQLSPVIKKLFNEDVHFFQSLLYRVDINEKDYKNSLSDIHSINFEEKISELIIRREFQKVITRKYFSEKNKQT